MKNTNTRRPEIIPGFEKQQSLNHPGLNQKRWDYPLLACTMVAADTARRVAASKASFPWMFFRGDCHSHSQHSDGIATVAEIAEMVKIAELDFQFVTDHWGITQAIECREHGLWVGQEPTTQFHHIGILGLDHAFEPQQDFVVDYATAIEKGATVFIPHPTGWWPNVEYSQEQKQVLQALTSPFLMEICNGANNIVSAFDYTDDSAIKLWDDLLCQGRQVHALGNTDAHLPHAIGMVWNGVFAENCDQAAIVAELKQGHSFVSDAPLVHIALGEARMGDTASTSDRSHELEVTAVDSRGLNSVAVIADGQEIFYRYFRGETEWKGSMEVPSVATKYVRVEAHSRDARRAYSNPIYFG